MLNNHGYIFSMLNHYKIPLNHHKIPLNHYKIPLNYYTLWLLNYYTLLLFIIPSGLFLIVIQWDINGILMGY